jgi:hypothetical protein
MKKPVGPLAMTEQEGAEFIRTGTWPTIEAPSHPDLPPADELAAAIRRYWRLESEAKGPKEGLREAREKLLSALDGPTPTPSGRRPGRPSSRDEEAREMLKIVADNLDCGDCRHLFEAAMRERSPAMKKAALLDHSKRAWKGAQELRADGA